MEPSASTGLADIALPDRGGDPTGSFATSPGGTQGYSINAELRVRY
jgi:hypothetical protein